MKQYCRYCAYLVTGNGIACTVSNQVLPEAYTKRVNTCKDFDFCEIDAYDHERKYKPREVVEKQIPGQMEITEILK